MLADEVSPAGRSSRYVYYGTLTAILLVWLSPLGAILLLSSRSSDELERGRYWGAPSLKDLAANYAAVFETTPFAGFLFNSLIITMSALVATLIVSTLAAYAIATARIRGGRFLLALFLAGNLVPPQILMIPVRDFMLDVLPLYNDRAALILFHTAFQTGFCTFFIANFMRAVPAECIESARLDGATEFAVLLRVVLPQIRPALAAVAVLEFTFIWNDYFWSLVLVQSDSVRPVTAALQTLKGMYTSSAHLLAAAAILAALAPAAVFFALQRYFVTGLTAGVVRR